MGNIFLLIDWNSNTLPDRQQWLPLAVESVTGETKRECFLGVAYIHTATTVAKASRRPIYITGNFMDKNIGHLIFYFGTI